MKPYNLCVQQKTQISQNLQSDIEDKIVNWQKYMIRLSKKQNLEYVHIGNIDESPVIFHMPSNRKVN